MKRLSQQSPKLLFSVRIRASLQFDTVCPLEKSKCYRNNKYPMQKSDLDQIGKLVRKIVREEVKTEVKDSTRTIENQIRLSRMQVQNEINELDDRMKNVEIRVDGVAEDVKDVIKRVRKTGKTVDSMFDLLDREQMEQRRKIIRIEKHLALP